MKKISTDGWVLFSTRDHSKNFKKEEEGIWLKVVDNDRRFLTLKDEFRKGNIIRELGIPVPKAIELVEVENEGYGLISEYFSDKISFTKAIAQDFENRSIYIKRYVALGKLLHSTKASDKLSNVKEIIKDAINVLDIFDIDEKNRLIRFMENIEDSDICLQVDYQFSNVISTSKGDFFIDMGLASHGNEIFDMAFFYNLITPYLYVDDRYEVLFHMSKENCYTCWVEFLKEYYGFITLDEINDFEMKLRPIGFLMACVGATETIKFYDALKLRKEEYFNKYF